MAPKDEKFDRGKLEDLLKRRFFYVPSFEIYGGKYLYFRNYGTFSALNFYSHSVFSDDWNLYGATKQ